MKYVMLNDADDMVNLERVTSISNLCELPDAWAIVFYRGNEVVCKWKFQSENAMIQAWFNLKKVIDPLRIFEI